VPVYLHKSLYREVVSLTTDYFNALRTVFTSRTTTEALGAKVIASSSSSFEIVFYQRGNSTFRTIGDLKRVTQEEFYNNLEEMYQQYGKTFNESNFQDIIHGSDSVIANQRAKSVSRTIKDLMATDNNVSEYLKNLGINLTLSKDDDLEEINVSIGSAYENKKLNASDKKLLAKYARRIEKVLPKLRKNPLELKGSDSFLSKRRKELIKASTKGFVKIKGARVKTEDTKIKKSSKKPVVKKVRPNATVIANTSIDNKVPINKFKRPKSSIVNLNSLIPIINMRLPETVANNMGTPKLNYRTGRFAASTRVTDINITPKGYPSIGFTYQREPYGVFEYPGGSPRLATPDRDPRKIIIQSIREIARGLINQRFYTRRT